MPTHRGYQVLIAGLLAAALVPVHAARAQDEPQAEPQKQANEPSPLERRLLVYPINEHVLRGALPDAADCAALAEDEHVKHIISLLPESAVPDDVKRAAASAGIDYEFVPILIGGEEDSAKPDGAGPESAESAGAESEVVIRHVDRAKVLDLVERFRKPGEGMTYMHCSSGRNRSAVVDFAYRLRVDHASYVDTLKEVIVRGFQASKNPGFLEDMKLIASGLDELPTVPIMPIDDVSLHIRGKRVSLPTGVQLHYKLMGSGPPLYLLHGGPGESHLVMRPFLDALADQNTLVYFDQRGCGYSSQPQFREAYSIDRMVADLDALRAELGHEKISLLGQSSGGGLAASYALAHPDRVDKLIVVSSWASAEEFGQSNRLAGFLLDANDIEKNNEIMRTLREQQRDFNDGELSRIWQAGGPSQFFGRLTPEFREDWRRRARVSALAFLSLIGEYLGGSDRVKPLDLRPRLGEIKDIPTLVVVGKFDVITPEQIVKTFADGIPGARFEVIDNCGHYPFVEQNEPFIKLVRDFLQGD